MSRSVFVLAALALAGCRDTVEPSLYTVASPSGATATYGAVDLGTLGGTTSSAAAINDDGQIVGASTLATGESHAFLWTGGVMTDLGTLGGATSNATDINATGQVVGLSATAAGEPRVFLWDGALRDLGPGPSNPWTLVKLNDQGQAAWTASVGSTTRAYYWNGSQTVDLGTLGGTSSTVSDINARGDVSGSSTMPDGETHAVVWQQGIIRDLGTLTGTSSSASGINDRGDVSGEWNYRVQDEYGFWIAYKRGFVWTDGVMTDLGPLSDGDGGRSDSYSRALAINNRGQIAGESFPFSWFPFHPVVWEGGAVVALRAEPNTWCQDRVAALNNSGVIVGQGGRCGREPAHATVWTDGLTFDLGTLGVPSRATAVNNRGDVVGSATLASGDTRAMLWRRGGGNTVAMR